MTKIIAISDLHGNLPLVPECDVFVLAGDAPPPGQTLPEQEEWFLGEFSEWLRSVPAKEIIRIAGNKDRALEADRELAVALPGIYLEDSSASAGGITFWGTPWVRGTGKTSWVFALSEEELLDAFSRIPPVDILVAHSPPWGFLDEEKNGTHWGSRSLLKQVQETKPPLLLCGHIHRQGLGQVQTGGTTVLSCSLLSGRTGAAGTRSREQAWSIDWQGDEDFVCQVVPLT